MEDNAPRLIYLVLLGVALAGWLWVENRRSAGRAAKHALAWGMIFVGVIAVVGLWQDVRDDVWLPRQSVIGEGETISVPRAGDGHYYLSLEMNGETVSFVVDTGASDIVLTREDAARIGIDPATLRFSGRATTANGTVATARARVDQIALGPIVDREVPVSVNNGEMRESLLGMTYLNRFERMEFSNGRLLLER